MSAFIIEKRSAARVHEKYRRNLDRGYTSSWPMLVYGSVFTALSIFHTELTFACSDFLEEVFDEEESYTCGGPGGGHRGGQ